MWQTPQRQFKREIRISLNTVEVNLPILAVLQATLDAGPCGDLTFICGDANGRPYTKESFGNEFKAACKAASLTGSAHGVRKIAATRAADNQATEAELMAIFGWTDPKMRRITRAPQTGSGSPLRRWAS